MKRNRRTFRVLAALLALLLLITPVLAEELPEADVHTVTLPACFSGEAVAAHGQEYRFTAADARWDMYDYQITAMVDGQTVTAVSKGEGVYAIANVTGDVVIDAIQMPKMFSVSVTGNGAKHVSYSSPTYYGTDYTFTADLDLLDVVITIGGEEYPHELPTEDGLAVLGWEVTGNIVIKATLKQQNRKVTFAGSGAKDAVGKNEATDGSYYSFSLRKADGYDYTVSAAMGTDPVEIIPDGESAYLIGPVADTLKITVEKTHQTAAPAKTPAVPAVPAVPTASQPLPDIPNPAPAVPGTPSESQTVIEDLPFDVVPLPEQETVPEETSPKPAPFVPELPEIVMEQQPEPEEKSVSPWWAAAIGGGVLLLAGGIVLASGKTVAFDTDGGRAIRKQRVLKGRMAARPAEPRKRGATFAGWFVDEARTKRWIFEKDKVRDHMTLYAKWL